MSEKLNHILTNPETAIRSTNDPLARLWRNILADIGMSPIAFHERLAKYLDDPANGITKETRSSTRGNRLKELSRDKLTWDLIMKGLEILDPEHVDISVSLRWSKNHTTYHAIGIPMRPVEPTEHVVEADGQKVTMKIPPLSQGRWAGVKLGGWEEDSDHVNIEYRSDTEVDDKGESK